MKVYYIESEGIYFQGIFWIGNDLEKGKKFADKLVEKDRDDYHEYWVKLYAEYDFSEDYTWEANGRGKKIYKGRK